jgi:hypothetical protein
MTFHGSNLPQTQFQSSYPGFALASFPAVLASPFWPTAPLTPAPKFVVIPQGLAPIPEYNWGEYGSTESKKKRAAKKAAKLRKRADEIEKKAGISKPRKTLKKVVESKAKQVTKLAKGQSSPSFDSETRVETPETEGVPQNAEEGADNMKLIIGGTIALMAAIGVGFVMKHQAKKRTAKTLEASTTEAVAQA